MPTTVVKDEDGRTYELVPLSQEQIDSATPEYLRGQDPFSYLEGGIIRIMFSFKSHFDEAILSKATHNLPNMLQLANLQFSTVPNSERRSGQAIIYVGDPSVVVSAIGQSFSPLQSSLVIAVIFDALRYFFRVFPDCKIDDVSLQFRSRTSSDVSTGASG